MSESDKIAVKIRAVKDRENMIIALANNGFKVWVETDHDILNQRYFVVFELSKKDINCDLEIPIRELVDEKS